MAKLKKVGFSYSLYKKGKYIEEHDIYPVYIKVIFNKKSTQFPCSNLENIPLILDHYLSEEDFLKVNNDKYYKNLEKYLEMVVRYEYSINGDSYQIKGIGNRLYKYFVPLENLFEFHYDMILTDDLGDILSFNAFRSLMDRWKMTYALTERAPVYSLFEMPELLRKISWYFKELEKEPKEVLVAFGAIIQPFFLYVLFDRQSRSDVLIGSNNYFVIDWISGTTVQANLNKFFKSFDIEEKVENLDVEKELFIETYKSFYFDSTYNDPIILINELEQALRVALPAYLESIK